MNFSRNEIDRQIDTREIYRYQIDRCRWIDDIDVQIDIDGQIDIQRDRQIDSQIERIQSK